jgi:asparagine synthase (glutamine-hydrolysing)
VSGIAGVWNLDGRPAEAAVLARMNEALRHRGPDGCSQIVRGDLGFAHQRLWVTPEEVGEVQPIVQPRGVMLVMDGRLDNRDELLPRLDLPATSSDATCVLEAHARWGDRFVEHLNGDFALAVYDAATRCLLLARDSIGVRPLYYHRSGKLFAFASEIKALIAHPDVPVGPDDEGLADFLLLGARPLDRQDVTCFADIRAVVPSHVLAVTPGGLETRRYWDFDPGHSMRFGSVGEGAEAFHERFARAVRRRARSFRPVVVSVSGGLDSSSVFCQAETLRRAGSAACPAVLALSYTGAPGTDADERRYLEDIEREYAVRAERFPIEPLIGLTDRAEEQVRASETPFLEYMWGVSRELHRRAAATGSRLLLSGHWGDQVLFSPAYLVDLFGRPAWGEIRRHLREYRRWFSEGEAGVLARRFPFEAGRHYVPEWLVPPLKRIRLRLTGGVRQKPWFTDRFLRRALRFANRPATIGSGFHSAHARSIYLEARSKYHVHCMEWNNKIAALHGLDAAFPFLDRDLLALLMAVPGERQNAGGVPRALLREAMRGVLPEAVRARTWKADFTDVVNRGVAQDAAVLAGLLSPEAAGVRLGYFDERRLSPEVARLTAKLDGADCLNSWDLADAFGLEIWLRMFLDTRDRPARREAM